MAIVGKSKDELIISKERIDVKEVIRMLCNKYGREFSEIALQNDELNPGLVIFLNGKHIVDFARLVDVRETDELQFMLASQMKGG